MDGVEGNAGVNTRALEQLFELLAAQAARRTENAIGGASTSNTTFTSKVRLSALEVYNEQIKDLLVDPKEYRKTIPNANASTIHSSLEILHTAEGGMHIPGLTSRDVTSVSEIKELIHTYVRANRSTASTAMNEHSSRSHLCLFVHVDTSSVTPTGETERTQGKLVLIDLAGSERVKRSQAEGQALKEAAHMLVYTHTHTHTHTNTCNPLSILGRCLISSVLLLLFVCS
jgi:kinesin family protein C2/C3